MFIKWIGRLHEKRNLFKIFIRKTEEKMKSFWAEEKLNKAREHDLKMEDWKNKTQVELEKDKKKLKKDKK